MNRLFRNIPQKIAILGSSAAIAATVIAPVSSTALAANRPMMADTNSSNSAGGFCSALANRESTFTGKVDTLKGKVSDTWSQQNTKLTDLAQSTDQKVTAARATADQKRQDAFKQLEAKATTDSEKAAVTTFENAVNQAVTTRRAAYDAARSAFRSGVETAVAAHRTSVTGQADAFQQAVQTAFTQATIECQNGTASATVRQDLVTALKAARTTFQSDRKNDSTVGSQVKQLAQTRNAAFKTADAAFKAALQTAVNNLKTAFGSDASKIE